MESERLILRKYKKEDLQDFYEYISNPNVVEFEPYKAMTLEEAKQNLEYRIGSNEFIAIELKESGKCIGNIYLGNRDFHAIEIGYVVNEKYWMKGYALEACGALIEDAFLRGIHRIYARCDPKNTGSWKLLEKLGFQREAHLKENVYFWTTNDNQPIWKDTYIYSCLNQS